MTTSFGIAVLYPCILHVLMIFKDLNSFSKTFKDWNYFPNIKDFPGFSWTVGTLCMMPPWTQFELCKLYQLLFLSEVFRKCLEWRVNQFLTIKGGIYDIDQLVRNIFLAKKCTSISKIWKRFHLTVLTYINTCVWMYVQTWVYKTQSKTIQPKFTLIVFKDLDLQCDGHFHLVFIKFRVSYK